MIVVGKGLKEGYREVGYVGIILECGDFFGFVLFVFFNVKVVVENIDFFVFV